MYHKVEAGTYRLVGTDITVQQGAGWWWLGHADKDDARLVDIERENQPYETLTYALQAWAQAGLVAVGHPQAAQDCLDKMVAAGANLPQAIAIATDLQALVASGQVDGSDAKWTATPKEGTVTTSTPKTTLKGYKSHNTLAQAESAAKRLATEQGRDIYVVRRKRTAWGLCSSYYVLQYSAPKDGKWLGHYVPRDEAIEALRAQLPASGYVPVWAAPADDEAIEKAANTYGHTTMLQDCALVHSATDLHGWGMYLAVSMEPSYVPLVLTTIQADAERIVLKARELGLTAGWEVAS
jgi:hypothetical protein